MRYLAALTGFLLIAASSPAAAQMYPGDDVTVNPSAAGTQVLLYPGGKYLRVVPALRQPGETGGPIHLHMPARHRVARVHHRRAVAAAPQAEAPVAAPPPTTTLSDFGDVAVARPANPAPAPQRSEPTPRRVMPMEPSPQRVAPPVVPPPQRVARTEPAPVRTTPPARISTPTRNPEADNGSKRSTVLFAPNASDPSGSALQTVKSLAGDLSALLSDGTARVQLLAYGGQRGDKSSDSRRLSLKRALIVRQILIDSGVPSERIDVRAMGGVDDNGPPDRVDVFLKS
ncbi:MAG: OmpA family protein [Rhizomicrobium sp.]|jgi:outer membrane protein OmpA-like peptidoglycan-associated protein